MKEFLHKYGEDMKDLEIESLRQKLAEWDEKAKNWMASPEARKRLAGYRSMGAMCAELEDNRDQLRRQLSNALAANEQNLKVYHAAAELLRQQLAEAEASERFAHSMLANRIVECDQLRKQVTPLREVLAHIHRCIPIGGFAQIHWDSATWVQIDEALAATEPEKIDDDP